MIGLRLASLGVVALLFGRAQAAPYPHNPAPGEIVHIAPDRTSGASVGTGGGIPHPHIALGPVGNGYHALAPVTHNSGSDHLRPHMPTPQDGNHQLGGITRLDHITAHSSDIRRSHGQHAGTYVGPQGLQDIRDGKALVAAHHHAANAHDGASGAYRGLANHHDALSSHHFTTGNAALGQHHGQQAALYHGHADSHATAADHHRTAAHNVNGGDATQHAHAMNSAAHASAAHHSLNTALGHEQQAHHLTQQANGINAQFPGHPQAAALHQQAAWHNAQPATHRANAVTSTGHAITAHGHATGN